MTGKPRRISKRWIKKTHEYFREFLDETNFPDPERIGERGPKFLYPEWMIMFIAVLSVKLKVKTYVQIHRMVTDCWDEIAQGTGLEPISERQLRDRLKKNLPSPSKSSSVHFSNIS